MRKPTNFAALLFFICMSIGLTSCELAGDIFKAGMGVGIFIVVAIIVGIIALISKAGGK